MKRQPFLLILFLCFASCITAKHKKYLPANPGNLKGWRWVLQSVEDTTAAQEGLSLLSFHSDNGTITGTLICNRISGSYVLDTLRQRLRFSKVGITGKACKQSRKEDAYLDLLLAVDHYEASCNALYFYSKGRKTATYSMSKGN